MEWIQDILIRLSRFILFFLDQKIKSLILKCFMFVLIEWIVFSVALSRIYCGVHSWNQILFGFLWVNLIVSLIMFFKKKSYWIYFLDFGRQKRGQGLEIVLFDCVCHCNVFLNIVVLFMYNFLRRNFYSGNKSWLVTNGFAQVCFWTASHCQVHTWWVFLNILHVGF